MSLPCAQAGNYTLKAALKGAVAMPAECQVACRAGPTSALHSQTELGGLSEWRAGQVGRLVITRMDRSATHPC
jgi:hypothetical protein